MDLSHLTFILLGWHINTYVIVTVIVTAEAENFRELGDQIKYSELKF